MEASFIYWYRLHKRTKHMRIVYTTNFAGVYTPTSVEVGEGITAKFACVDFASSKVSSSPLTTSQLVVALRSYGVLQVATVFRYSRYGSYGAVT